MVYHEVFGPDPAQAEGSLRELRARVAELRPRETELVRLGISPHAPYTVSDDLFRAAALLAREEELPIAIHIVDEIGFGWAAGRVVAECCLDLCRSLKCRSISVLRGARTRY